MINIREHKNQKDARKKFEAFAIKDGVNVRLGFFDSREAAEAAVKNSTTQKAEVEILDEMPDEDHEDAPAHHYSKKKKGKR